MRQPAPTRPPFPTLPGRSGLVAGTLFLLGASGCGSDAGPSRTVTDSAGVEIVHSSRPSWTAETAWRVAPEPRLEIGRRSGEDAYILDRVMGVTVLDDGGIAIAHMGDNTIRFYDSAGRFVRKVGGQGDGPQEFRQIMGLERQGDEIRGRQFGRNPTRVFDQAGTFIRTVSADIPMGMAGAGVRGTFEDGSLLIGDWPQSREPTPEPRVAMATLLRQAGDHLDTLAVVPAVRILPLPGRPGGLYQEFSPRLGVAVAGNVFYHAFPENYEIIARDTTGAIRRIIRREWQPVRVTEAHVAESSEALLNMGAEGGGEVSPRLREGRQAMIDAQVPPEYHPAFERLVVAPTGHLWTERPDPDNPKAYAGWHQLRDTPTTWDVFSPEGIWLGSIDLPPRFMAYEFGEDHVAGVWKDEMDVEFVRVYALERDGER